MRPRPERWHSTIDVSGLSLKLYPRRDRQSSDIQFTVPWNVQPSFKRNVARAMLVHARGVRMARRLRVFPAKRSSMSGSSFCCGGHGVEMFAYQVM